jgi:hypothetical protein
MNVPITKDTVELPFLVDLSAQVLLDRSNHSSLIIPTKTGHRSIPISQRMLKIRASKHDRTLRAQQRKPGIFLEVIDDSVSVTME